MPTDLIIHDIEPALLRALAVTAAAHGRSTEAEHREILRAALTPRKRRTLKEVLASLPDVGTDGDFDWRGG